MESKVLLVKVTNSSCGYNHDDILLIQPNDSNFSIESWKSGYNYHFDIHPLKSTIGERISWVMYYNQVDILSGMSPMVGSSNGGDNYEFQQAIQNLANAISNMNYSNPSPVLMDSNLTLMMDRMSQYFEDLRNSRLAEEAKMQPKKLNITKISPSAKRRNFLLFKHK